MGSLAGFDETERTEDLPELERFVLHRLAELDVLIRDAVASHDWTGVYPAVHSFCAADLSAFYFDIRKDAIYCDRPDAPRRRAARTVLDHLHRCLCTWLAPVMPFTAEEAWIARFGEADSVHLHTFPTIPAGWGDRDLAPKWHALREVRRVITTALEASRQAGQITASLQARVELTLPDAEFAALAGTDWAELAIVSDVAVRKGEAVEATVGVADGQKCARCWRVLPEVGQSARHPLLCRRCEDAVESGLVCRSAA